VPRRLRERLADSLMRYWRPRLLWELATAGPLPGTDAGRLVVEPTRPLRVAIAYDEAFHCYFPDTLDCFDLRGASVMDFSPLHDESLPAGTDVVYLGCGSPERYATALAENHCIKAALREHLRGGGRIYAEGAGLAYLCQYLETADGGWARMVGLVAAVARLRRRRGVPLPVQIALPRTTWLGPKGTLLRGYLTARWRLEPAGYPIRPQRGSHRCPALVVSPQLVGSLVHLDFAAQPELLARFFFPEPSASLKPGSMPLTPLAARPIL